MKQLRVQAILSLILIGSVALAYLAFGAFFGQILFVPIIFFLAALLASRKYGPLLLYPFILSLGYLVILAILGSLSPGISFFDELTLSNLSYSLTLTLLPTALG